MDTRRSIELEEKIEYWETRECMSFDSLNCAEKNQLAEAYFQRGELYAETEPEKALEDYAQSIILCPQLSKAYFRRGQLYIRQGEHAKGEKDRVLAWLYAGMQAVSAGERNEAEKYYCAIRRATVSIPILLYCQLQLLKLGQEEAMCGLIYYKELYKPDGQMDNSFIWTLMQCYMKNYSQIKIDFLTLKNLSCWLHRDMFDLLCNQHCWKEQYIPVTASKSELGGLKTLLVEMMMNLNDKILKLNAGLQSFCKATSLGGLFHLQRGCFMPDISRGRLKKIAVFLNACAPDLSAQTVSETTKLALRDEQARNPAFRKMLKKYYPQLYILIKLYFKSDPVASTLFGKSPAEAAGAEYKMMDRRWSPFHTN